MRKKGVLRRALAGAMALLMSLSCFAETGIEVNAARNPKPSVEELIGPLNLTVPCDIELKYVRSSTKTGRYKNTNAVFRPGDTTAEVEFDITFPTGDTYHVKDMAICKNRGGEAHEGKGKASFMLKNWTMRTQDVSSKYSTLDEFLGAYPNAKVVCDEPVTEDTIWYFYLNQYAYNMEFVANVDGYSSDQPYEGNHVFHVTMPEAYCNNVPNIPDGPDGPDNPLLPPSYVTVHKKSEHPQFDTGNDNYTLNDAVFHVMSNENPDCAQDASCLDRLTCPILGAVDVDASTSGAPVPDKRDSVADTDEIKINCNTDAQISEVTAPKGFAINNTIENVSPVPDESVDVTFSNEPYRSPVRILIGGKDDRELHLDTPVDNMRGISTREPQGDGIFSGAEFHVSIYNKKSSFDGGKQPIIEFDTVSVDIEGKDYGMVDFSKSAITNFVNHADGGFTVDDYFIDDDRAFSFPLGYIVVTETKAPVGYTLEDPNMTVIIDYANEDKAMVYGPQFAFTVTEENCEFLGSNGEPISDDSILANAYSLKYLEPAEFAKMKAQSDSENMNSTQTDDYGDVIGVTPMNYYTIQPNGRADILVVSQKKRYDEGWSPKDLATGTDNPVFDVIGWRKVYKTGVALDDAWKGEFAKKDGLFRVSYESDASISDVNPISMEEIVDLYGSEIDYYIWGQYPNFDTAGFLPAGAVGAKKTYITVSGGAPEIKFDATPVDYRGYHFEGCYYFEDASGNKIYLSYMDPNLGSKKDAAPFSTWGGVPLIPLDKNASAPAKNISDIGVFQERCRQAKNMSADKAGMNVELATEPYLIKYDHEFHALEQVIRGDVQIEKFDYEKHGPEATGASHKSNTDDGRDDAYKGTHMDKITFAIFNVSNHYVIDPVSKKVIMPNELFCTIDTHWNPQMNSYTAETTNGRLPFGTYAIREWSQDIKATYNLSDPQARIFEIRKNGRLQYDDKTGSQWVVTWTAAPDSWNDTAKWKQRPFNPDKYDNETAGDNDASWVKGGDPGRRSGAENSYATFTPGTTEYEKRVVSEGWKVNEDTTGGPTQKEGRANWEIRDTAAGKQEMIFKNFPVRSDITLKKVRDTLDGDAPVSSLFVITNNMTGEQHVIFTNENGEYSSGPVAGGNGFQDHDVNTNSLDELFPLIEKNKSADIPIKLWPDSVQVGGEYGDIPEKFFNIDKDSGTYTWNPKMVGGIWFSKGENGTYTTYVREFKDYDNMPGLPAYVDKIAEELSYNGRRPKMADIGHTELVKDAGKVVGIPLNAAIRDTTYATDEGWNIRQAARGLVNNYYTDTRPKGNQDSLEYLRNTDADTTDSVTGHQVTFERSGIHSWVRGFLSAAGGDNLSKLLADGGADHTKIQNIDAGNSNMPDNNQTGSGKKAGYTDMGKGGPGGESLAGGSHTDAIAVLHIDGYHQDTRKADLQEHFFGALPYGEYSLQEVRTSETSNDHLLNYAFQITSQGEVKDLGTIEDKLIEPKISTQALDQANDTQVSIGMNGSQIVDTVRYEGLSTDTWYTMEGSLYDLTAKEPVRYKDGTEVRVQTTFRPVLQDGMVDIVFGQQDVAGAKMYESWESAYEACRQLWDNGNTNAEVKSVNCFDENDKPYTRYYVADKITGDSLEKGDDTVVGRELDMTPYRGHKIIVYETCYDQQKNPVAEHIDDADEHQMIYFPELGSKADTMLATDKKVSDKVFYEQLKGTDGYTYANITGIVKDDGRVLSEQDMKLFKEENVLRDGNGQIIPCADEAVIRSYFTSDKALPVGNYYLETALYDETAKAFVYDKYNPDGSLVYDSENGYGVFSMVDDKNVYFEAYYNPVTKEYMMYDGGTEWKKPVNGYPMAVELAKESIKDKDGNVYEELITPLVSNVCIKRQEFDERLTGETVETEFTADTSVLSGHKISAYNVLYTMEGATCDVNLVHDGDGMFYPAANQISNIEVNASAIFKEKARPEDGILAIGTPYKFTAYLLDKNGEVLKDRYGRSVSWFYGGENSANAQTYTHKKEGIWEFPVTFLGGMSSIGADYIFENKLSVQVVAERGTTERIVVGEWPISIKKYGGTEYEAVNVNYGADGKQLANVSGKTDFKAGYQAAGAVDDTFWDFYVNPANYVNRDDFNKDLSSHSGYYYTLRDYTAEIDDLHTVKVEDTGLLTGMSRLPFIFEGKGEALTDRVLCTGLTVGDEYTLRVDFYNNGKLLGTEYKEFMATGKSEVQDVVYYPIDASAVEGKLQGPYTVKESIKHGVVTLDHDFAFLDADTAKTGAGASGKKVTVVRSLKFKENSDGEWVTEDFGDAYADLFITAQKVWPQDEGSGELKASMKLDASVLKRANANTMTFTNEIYTIDRLGFWSLADFHADLENQAEQLRFGVRDKGLGTTATVDGNKTVKPSQGTVTVTDIVEYHGYDDVRKATLKGELIQKSTGKAIAEAEKDVEIDPSGSGSVEITFTVDVSKIGSGDSLVVFEELYDIRGELIGSHKDITDEGQTVTVDEKPDKPENPETPDEPDKPSGGGGKHKDKTPDSPKNPENPSTPNTPETPAGPWLRTMAHVGTSKFVTPGKNITITDTVSYGGYPAGKYTMVGYLVRKSTGEVLVDGSGRPITARTDFDSTGAGQVAMNFTFDSSIFTPGEGLVVFENMLDAEGNIVGSHLDINDADQTVVFKTYTKVQTGVDDGNFVLALIVFLADAVVLGSILYCVYKKRRLR